MTRLDVEGIKFDERGLVPAVVQDARTGEVLTLAYMNAESLRRTKESGETWFWSRSRAALWHKGETSGNTQRVVSLRADCDGDTLLVAVEPAGPACHTGARTCFEPAGDEAREGAATKVSEGAATKVTGERHAQNSVGGGEGSGAGEVSASDLGAELGRLHALVAKRRAERPADSYTTYLFDAGLDKILKKVGEESTETIIAAKNPERGPLVAETADLLYHLVVLLVERGVTTEEVAAELARRGTKAGAKE